MGYLGDWIHPRDDSFADKPGLDGRAGSGKQLRHRFDWNRQPVLPAQKTVAVSSFGSAGSLSAAVGCLPTAVGMKPVVWTWIGSVTVMRIFVAPSSICR